MSFLERKIIMQQRINLIEKRYVCFVLVLVIAAGVSFVRYNNLNLNSSSTSLPSFFVEWEEKTRHEHWSEMVEKEQDPFITKIFNDQKSYRINWGLYHFLNLPTHFFYKIFHLRGVNLWLATKLLVTCLGIGVVLLVFLIADLFYGPFVGLMASILMAFSPHIWVLYNFSADPSQPYNLFLSLLTIYLFLLFMESKNHCFIIISGFVMGANFLFFHVGSFLIPIIIFLFCAYNYLMTKKFIYIRNFFIIVLIAIFSGAVLNYFHSSYLNLPYNPIITYIRDYLSWGPTASHTIHGIVIFDLDRLVLNTKHHIQGVFLNGKTQDWHYGSSPPSIPMIYNYLISFLFASGCFIFIRNRNQEDIFFIIWFFAYFFIYTMLVFVRPKNIVGEIAPIFILAARMVPVIGTSLNNKIKKFGETPPVFILAARSVPTISDPLDSLYNKIKKFSEKKWIYTLSVLLVISSIGFGSYRIFYFLPSKNFYGAYRGHYQVYQHLSKKGYTDKTKIMFTSTDSVPDANMMLRLFTENIPQIINLTDFGILPGADEKDRKNKWLELESNLKKDSDKIFYCFTKINNT